VRVRGQAMVSSLASAEAATALPLHYPAQLIETRCLAGGKNLVLRPVLPQDEARLAAMLQAQSADALRRRFHGAVRPSACWCRRMSRVDYRQQLALVVCAWASPEEHVVGEARYSLLDDALSADCAMMVDSRWQRRGLGRWMLGALLHAAADAGLQALTCEVLIDNQPMLTLAQRCGFTPVALAHDGRLLRLQRSLGVAVHSPGAAGRLPVNVVGVNAEVGLLRSS
jgi:acetyltransferase